VIVYGGAAIAYKVKMQPMVDTSLREDEFIAAVFAARAVKHLHSVLTNFKLSESTIIYEVNKAAKQLLALGILMCINLLFKNGGIKAILECVI